MPDGAERQRSPASPYPETVTHRSPNEPATAAEHLQEATRVQVERGPRQSAGRDGVLLAVARVLRRLSEEIAIIGARNTVKAFVAERPSVEDAMAFAYGFQLAGFEAGIQPSQIPSEIEALLRRLDAARPRAVLEIGTGRGGTLFLLASTATDDALFVSIDLPEGAFGGGYRVRRGKLYRAFARRGQRIALLRRDSHDLETVRLVRRLLAGRPVDLLFIDGDHTYEGVRRDYASYSPLVRPGGLVAIHDIVPGNHEDVGGVPRFWQELKETADVEELVGNWKQGGFGIGLLTRPAS